MGLSCIRLTAGRRLERMAGLLGAVPLGTSLTLGPRVRTYFLSFLTLGIFWNGQRTMLNLFASADRDRVLRMDH